MPLGKRKRDGTIVDDCRNVKPNYQELHARAASDAQSKLFSQQLDVILTGVFACQVPSINLAIQDFSAGPQMFFNSEDAHSGGFFVALTIENGAVLSEQCAVREIVRSMPVYATDERGGGGADEHGNNMDATAIRYCLRDKSLTDDGSNRSVLSFLVMTDRSREEVETDDHLIFATPPGITPIEFSRNLAMRLAYSCSRVSVSSLPNASFAKRWINAVGGARGYMVAQCWEVWQSIKNGAQSEANSYREKSFGTWIQQFWKERRGCKLEAGCLCNFCAEDNFEP